MQSDLQGEVCESLADTSWMLDIGLTNPAIIQEVYNYRQKDSHRLYKQLDECQRQLNSRMKNVGTSKGGGDGHIMRFLQLIVHLHCHCIESIKLARTLEKLLTPWKVSHKADIKKIYGEYITETIKQEDLVVDRLVALSNLLEQNPLARESVEGDVSPMLTWLHGHLDSLLQRNPSQLTKVQTQQLYALVKIALQLFQSCPRQTCSKMWTSKTDDQSDLVLRIGKSLLTILHSQHYAADCTILAGTALASLTTSAPTPQTALSFFLQVYDMVNSVGQQMSALIPLPSSCDSSLNMTDVSYKLGIISLIKGIVACASSELMNLRVKISISKHDNRNSKNREEQTFVMQLFPIICKLCTGPISLHYHAFTLLNSWYQKLLQNFSHHNGLQLNIGLSSNIVESTVHLVWVNWDSPVEDVSDLAIGCLKCLLELWDVSHTKSPESDKEALSIKLLENLQDVPWFSKGKYKVLAVLFPFLRFQDILKDTELPWQLLKCLSTNYLAPSGGDIYKAYLQFIKGKVTEDKQIAVWKDLWLETMEEGIISNSLLVRNNIYHYWISGTVKILPSVAAFLHDHWQHHLTTDGGGNSIKRCLVLHAYISLSKVIRGQLGNQVQDKSLLQEALYSSDDDLRSEAISLLCISLKKAEPLSPLEDELLRETVPINLKVDSAPFRQHLSADLKKLLVRIRDSCLGMLKTKQLEPLDRTVEFIDWLHSTCITNLVPGSCYQRRKTCLDLLGIIYDTLIYDDGVKQRKAFTPAAAQKLLEYATRKGKWNFFSLPNTVSLIRTLMDGADEVQESVGHLLIQYCKWPLMTDGHLHTTSDSLAGHLLTTALNLCGSPKTHESQSGALLCKILFQKYVVDLSWRFEMKEQDDLDLLCTSVSSCDRSVQDEAPPSVMFLTTLLSYVKNCLQAAESNVVTASQKYPLHGFISAVTRCMSETSTLDGDQADLILPVVHSLLHTDTETIDFMLEVMNKGSENDSCPSFAELGEALEGLIEESQSDYSSSTTLSVEHQYLLSWCWVNIKESCMSLGTLSQLLMARSSLQLSDITTLKNVFLKILTKCRHRGVIEGCRSAFIKFCSALFDSSDSVISDIPHLILQEGTEDLIMYFIFTHLSGIQAFARLLDTAEQTSTTRKSAGLPIIVQSIISCEKRLKKSTLLVYTLDKLFEISSQSVPADFDDRHDLAQVHGLNILKSLFSDASLSAVLMPYISRAVILVVQMFGSPAWAIRNAATRLFSSLMVRIFGQKKSVDDVTLNTLTIQELSAHYPELPAFIKSELESALQRDITAIGQLHPSLFPVLTMLACLGTSESSSEDCYTQVISQMVWHFLESPVFYLRQLGSSAYVALVSGDKAISTILSLLSKIPCDCHIKTRNNLWHSLLLCVEKLLLRQSYCESEINKALSRFRSLSWLLNSANIHDVVKAKYVDTVRLLYRTYPQLCEGLILEVIHTEEVHGSPYKLPMCLTRRSLSESTFHHITNTKAIPDGFLASIKVYGTDSVIFFIDGLSKLMRKGLFTRDFWQRVQVSLCELALQQRYPPLLADCLTLVSDIHRKFGTEGNAVSEDLWRHTREITAGQGRVGAASLEIGGVCVKCWIKQGWIECQQLLEMCRSVKCASEMIGSENHRTSAARVLLMTGSEVLEYCHKTRDHTLCKSAMLIFQASLNLIQDDDIDIREIAVEFLSKLDWPGRSCKYSSVQYSSCLQIVMEYFCDMFWWSSVVIQDLSRLLYKPGDVQCTITTRGKQSRQLFEQEDNNFFAEKLFTGLHIGNLLMRMLLKSEENGEIHHLHEIEVNQVLILEDLNFVYRELKGCEGQSVVNVFSNPGVLASVCHLLLFTMFTVKLCTLTQTCSKTTTLLQDMYTCVLQSEHLPSALFTLVSKNLTKESDACKTE